MLVSSQLSQVPTVSCLVSIWAERYALDLSQSTLDLNYVSQVSEKLQARASPMGRTRTLEKMTPKVVNESCKLAAIRAKELYTNLSDTLSLTEARHLAQDASQIYLTLLDIYQTGWANEGTATTSPANPDADLSLTRLELPNIDRLADALEPLLLASQERHTRSQDWRTLGFITTQFNFSNALLLERLTPLEQVLITPYFKFLEEQVALPWQRICAAAANHDADSPAFLVVKQLLPRVSEISEVIYNRMCQFYPTLYSRRGLLTSPEIKHSSLRDISMFQAYLFLGVLQGNLNGVEQELIPLCQMVFESIRVPWKMAVRGVESLMEEMMNRLESQQIGVIQTYTENMIKAFQAQV